MVATASVDQNRHDLTRFLKFTFPYSAVHLACLFVFMVGVSWFAIAVSVVVYLLRGIGITGFYHRKFSHHAFKTGRIVQFLGAWLGTSAAQGGPLWWGAHHRHITERRTKKEICIHPELRGSVSLIMDGSPAATRIPPIWMMWQISPFTRSCVGWTAMRGYRSLLPRSDSSPSE